jgi:hypothetical protein
MSDWTDGFRRALVDLDRLARSRGIALAPAMLELLADLDGDALVIEREQTNRIRRRRLALAREELARDELPLFEAPP